MRTKVINLRYDEPPVEGYVYIGRPSKWGNSFKIGVDGTRQEVVMKYRAWLLSQPSLMADLPSLKDKVLGCWCKPALCHGDVLAELADHVSL